jgi:hypothetical protein
MMPEDNDTLCPWCLGELPGKPGQVAKCRHCGSDIHWGDGQPYKTKFQAAQPNPVVRDVPVKLKPTPRVPREIENESGPESSFVMEDVSEIIGELHAYEKADTQIKQIVASRYGDDISWGEWWRGCPLWQKIFFIGIPIVVVSFISLVVSVEVMKAYELGPFAEQPALSRLTAETTSLASIDKDVQPTPKLDVEFFENPDRITSLTTEQAAGLVAKDAGELYLDSLTSIDKEVAQELGKVKGSLTLGLTSIDKDVAQELANFEGEELFLGGLTSIDKEVAQELGNIKSSLTLGLTSINKDVAQGLATFEKGGLIRGPVGLHLDGLTSIDKDVAQELAKYHWHLFLNGLTSIDKDVAQELAEVKEGLFFDGLKSIDKDVAQELAKKRGHIENGLSLNGLTLIDKDVARVLAKFRGLLSLSGLTSIDKEVSQDLAKFEGEKLWLGGPTSIDKDVAQELVKFKGSLTLGLTSINKDVAQELAKFEGESLYLHGLTSIDKEVLDVLKSNPKILLHHKYRD